MDPKANIEEQVEIARRIEHGFADYGTDYSPEKLLHDTDRLAELILALHEWRENGGYDPYQA